MSEPTRGISVQIADVATGHTGIAISRDAETIDDVAELVYHALLGAGFAQSGVITALRTVAENHEMRNPGPAE
jgi:hypothetical protein